MKWQCGGRTFDCDGRTLLMGVVNATPDSFSDGGKYFSADAAIGRGLELLKDGADIIDVGGESTRPGALPVEEEEEKRRVLPVIEGLAAAGACVSADTMKPGVMRAALEHGAAIINDVNGFRAPGAIEAVNTVTVTAKTDGGEGGEKCGLVIMHMRGSPAQMQRAPRYDDVVGEVGKFLRERLAALVEAGVAAARVCVDPGIGFGKTAEHNKALLANLPSFAFGCPVLIGLSRKSFFAAVSSTPAERDAAGAAAAALLVGRGAHVVRVHNVQATRQALAAQELLAEAKAEAAKDTDAAKEAAANAEVDALTGAPPPAPPPAPPQRAASPQRTSPQRDKDAAADAVVDALTGDIPPPQAAAPPQRSKTAMEIAMETAMENAMANKSKTPASKPKASKPKKPKKQKE